MKNMAHCSKRPDPVPGPSSGGSYYLKKNESFKLIPESDGWMRLGIVKDLIIYPVDLGTGLHENSVICTRDGPEFDRTTLIEKDTKDRRLVLMNKNELGFNVVNLNPHKTVLNCSAIERYYYGDPNRIENDDLKHMRIMKPLYERMPIIVRNQYLKKLQVMYNTHPLSRKYKIGYFAPRDRRNLNSQVRYTHENNSLSGLLTNYSHYTLINSKSIESLKYKFNEYSEILSLEVVRAKYINYLNFFPHIVIEGDEGSEYHEDAVKHVKIRNVEFDDILPCVTSEAVNYNYNNESKPFLHLYRFLQERRPVSVIYNELSHDDSDRPVFGINMEKKETGLPDIRRNNRIRVGDIVYVKY